MTQGTVAIISILVNFLLAVLKLLAGVITGSLALIADAIHSGSDIFSSIVVFLGIKASQKPADKEHPYGHYRYESLAGFIVAIIIGISGVWIVYESLIHFFSPEQILYTSWAIFLMFGSILANEAMAQLKFKYGHKYQSLSLVADAEHSRADAISSVGVLLGLILIKYFIFADAIVGILIGVYIIKQSWGLGKEIADSLLDVANEDVEEKIKKICSAHKIEISEIKTRKIGAANFAEIKILLPLKLKVEAVGKITKSLEERLIKNIPDLKHIVISIEPYHMKRSTIITKFSQKICKLEGFEKIGPKKRGERTIIPVENNLVSPIFGAKNYLVVDKEGDKILLKEMIKNPYFGKDSAHGSRFAKAIRADKVITRQIGANARQGLTNFGIEIEITKQTNLENVNR